MPVVFDGTQLIPAPLVSITKTYVKDDQGMKIHPLYNFVLSGTIVNVGTDKDSPGAQDFGFADMNDILGEQKRIREAFTKDGGRLEITAPPAGGPDNIDAFCTVDSINFSQSTWTTRCDYTITLTANQIEGDTETYPELESFSESWNIEENINGTFSIGHELSAVGLPVYDGLGLANNPLNRAKNWCKARTIVLGTDGTLAYFASSGSIDFSNVISSIAVVSGNYWNHVLSESPGITEASWTVAETMIHDPSGSAREDFNVSYTLDAADFKKSNVTLTGTVTGNANKESNLPLRNSRASGHFEVSIVPNLFLRANRYAPLGFTVTPQPNSRQVEYDTQNGLLNYTYTFAASSGTLFSDALEESINVSDSGPVDVFAEIQVPGRANGPVVQYMNTVTLPTRTVNITLTFPAETAPLTVASLSNIYHTRPNTNAFVDALKPNAGFYFLTQNTEDWNPIQKQYSRTTAWTLQPEGLAVSGVPVPINNPSSS